MTTIPDAMFVQGIELSSSQIQQAQQLFAHNPKLLRTPASKILCEMWNWRNELGKPKDMACRILLRKLEARGVLSLPPRATGGGGHRKHIAPVIHDSSPITCTLPELLPLRLQDARASADLNQLFCHLVATYHYLGLRDMGRNIKYIAFDRLDRPVACLLFGAAAWKVHPRDQFVGWDAASRQRNLQRITNNTRFLILPWVRVPHLASHLLASGLRRLPHDWAQRYGPVALVETFVDRSRFQGTCYKAANWIRVGQTKGRSRQDRHTSIHVPVKDIYLYPLRKDFRKCLTQ